VSRITAGVDAADTAGAQPSGASSGAYAEIANLAGSAGNIASATVGSVTRDVRAGSVAIDLIDGTPAGACGPAGRVRGAGCRTNTYAAALVCPCAAALVRACARRRPGQGCVTADPGRRQAAARHVGGASAADLQKGETRDDHSCSQ
jgi:hypothetical protein